MYHNQVIYTVVAIAVIATSCERLSSSDSDKVDKTKDWTEVVTMVVSHEISAVYDMEGIPSEGMMVKEDGKKDWNPMYLWEIEGFEYVRGFEYHLKVEKTHLVDPPQDASSVKYKLIEILSEEFKLGEGYVMSDEYILTLGVTELDFGKEYRVALTPKENEYYLILKMSEKESALDYLSDNGFVILENSETNPGIFATHAGTLDCIQLTVKGSGDLSAIPGHIYTSPLYGENGRTIGRSNMIVVGYDYDGDDGKFERHMAYIEKFSEILGLSIIEKVDHRDLGWGYFELYATNNSLGNVIECHNWFTEVARYGITGIQFPEWAPTPDAL